MFKLTAFPKQLSLRDGDTVTVRPLEASDEAALLDFFRRVDERERFFLKDDVTSPDLIHRWSTQLDYKRTLPLLALAQQRVVGNGVLIRSRHGAYARVAGLRIVVDASYRGRGLGTGLMQALCDVAADADLDRVIAELVVGVQDDAIAAAEGLSFLRAATIHEHLRDGAGRTHDVAVMVLPLGKWYEWSKF